MNRLTLGLAHELGLNAAITAALLIVLLGGEFSPVFWLTAFAPTVSMALSRRGLHVPAVSGTLLGLGAIGAAAVSLLRSGLESAVFAGGVAIMGLLVARVLTRRTLEHDLQAMLLSLILVFAGSVLNVGMSYIVVFVAYGIAAVWALSTRQLLAGARDAGMSARQAGERDDVITPLFFVATGGLAVAVLAAAVVVFVSFPRIGFGELGFLGRKETQLPPKVGFGSDPRGLSTSTAVVARVRGVPLESFTEGLYLRGTVYDVVTLDAFSQSDPDTAKAPIEDFRAALPTLARQQTRDVQYDVLLMPIAGPVIFTLGATRSSLAVSGGAANPNRSQQIGGRDRHDQLRAQASLASPLRYRVNGDIAVVGAVPLPSDRPPRLAVKERDRFLQVPPEDAAIRRLLDEMLQRTPPEAPVEVRAAAVREFLLKRYRYSLDGVVVGQRNPLRAFLVDARVGHCEIFAGGYVLLLRMMGVPARVVGGFQGGALTDDDSVVFQQRHAHAWVEWWQEDVGWIVDDATPTATMPRERLSGLDGLLERLSAFWGDSVVDYALEDQQVAVSAVARALRGLHLGSLVKGGLVAVVVIGPVVMLLLRLRQRRRLGIAGDVLAREILEAAERWSGVRATPSATIREVVEASPHPLLRAAVDIYERARFGGPPVERTRVDTLRRELRALRRAAGPGSR